MLQFNQDTSFISGALVWVDEIPQINLTTDLPVVGLSVILNGQTVHSVDLYPYKGALSVYVADIIREEMELQNLPMSTVSVQAKGGASVVSVSFRPVYRRRAGIIPVEDFCRRNFLTLTRMRRLPFGQPDSVSLIPAAGETVDIVKTCHWQTPDGRRITTETSNSLGLQNYSRVLTVDVAWPETPEGCEPIVMTLTAGERRAVWYHLKEVGSVFAFDNVFGVMERHYTRASVSRKISAKGSLAKVLGRLIRYDEEETEEITVTFSPALPEEILSITQMPSARTLLWTERPGDPLQRVIVTQSELEADQDPDELLRPSLTFRRDNTLPEVPWPETGRIFTAQFAAQFR